jgi:3-phosphoglycerate kinase
MTEAVPHGSRRACIDDLTTEFVSSKTVLLRVDYNVPVQSAGDGEHTWIVANDAKIRASIPTINALLAAGAKVILISHMGRPPFDVPIEERIHSRYSLNSVMYKLSQYIENTNVYFSPGPRKELQAVMQGGDLLLCENTRFQGEVEEHCDPALAIALADGIDIFVNDAVSTCHRNHASVTGIPQVIASGISVLGLAAREEIIALNRCITNPARPFAAIIGGAKLGTKLPVLNSLVGKVDILVIGGAMSHTFMLSKGLSVGESLVEQSPAMLSLATDVINLCSRSGVKLLLPSDFVMEQHRGDTTEVITAAAIPDDASAFDIGPQTVNTIVDALGACKTVLWSRYISLRLICQSFPSNSLLLTPPLLHTNYHQRWTSR